MSAAPTDRPRIVFMGAPAFAARCLKQLLDDGHDVVAVYSQPPRPAGRGKKLRPTPVAELAARCGIEARTPARLRAPDALAEFQAYAADIAVVVAYGQILPAAALEAPRLGCVNLHASLLPRWRGAAPIQRAIMAGDSETGVCVMRMTEGLDEGPVIARRTTAIGPDDTAGGLFDRLAEIGAPLLSQTVRAMAAGEAVETPQPEQGVTYAEKIRKDEAEIDWSNAAEIIDRQIRGLSPAPGAWCRFEPDADGAGPPERLKILLSRVEATIVIEEEAAPGRTLDSELLVATGAPGQAVRLLTVQRAGRGVQDAETFLRGAPVAPGRLLAKQE